MLSQQGLSATAQPRVDVGSLFVPTRAPSSRAKNNSCSTHPHTVCRISGLQRQASAFQDDSSAGLLLPPQHLVYPGAPVTVPVHQQQGPAREQQHQQAPAAPAPAPAGTAKPKLRISWAGSGVYFFWQLGAMQYLMNKFHLAKVPMVGASGGGFAAVLSACEVPPEQVLETAYALSLKHNIWERPLGLMGTWGGLVEQWLHDLLPADAAERCSGQVGIVVTQLPFCNQVSISDFKDKADLINVAMASAHVPMFLDWKVSRDCRGVQCVDGSFPDFFAGVNCDLLQCGGEAVVFDYFDDPNIVRNGRMDMLSLKEYREFKKIILLGYKFAQRMDDEGAYERFCTAGVDKKSLIL